MEEEGRGRERKDTHKGFSRLQTTELLLRASADAAREGDPDDSSSQWRGRPILVLILSPLGPAYSRQAATSSNHLGRC